MPKNPKCLLSPQPPVYPIVVRNLGLFPWMYFESLDDVKNTLFEDNEQTWEDAILYYDNIKTDINEALVFYWRIRKWKITGTFYIDTFDGPRPVDFRYDLERDANKEIELICKYLTEVNTFIPIPLSGDTEFQYFHPDYTNPYSAELFFQFPSTGFFGGIREDKPYFPMANHFIEKNELATHISFEFLGNPSGGDFIASEASLLKLTAGEGMPPPTLTQGLIKYFKDQDLRQLQFSYYLRDTNLPIANLVIEATEYWEYDPEDGYGPIYDKFSGCQLRDF